MNTVPLRLLDCLGLLPGAVFGFVVCDLTGGAREAVEGGKEEEAVEEEAGGGGGGGGRSRIADGEGILMLSMPWDCDDVDVDVDVDIDVECILV